MENNKEFFIMHKKKIIATIILILLFLLFLVVRGMNNKTDDAETYQTHLVTSNEKSRNMMYNLLVYLDSIGTRLVDCDQDVAVKLEEFAKEFEDEASNFKSMTYSGSEKIVGSELYTELSLIYQGVAQNLRSISSAIKAKNKDDVSRYFNELKENLQKIEDRS